MHVHATCALLPRAKPVSAGMNGKLARPHDWHLIAELPEITIGVFVAGPLQELCALPAMAHSGRAVASSSATEQGVSWMQLRCCWPRRPRAARVLR